MNDLTPQEEADYRRHKTTIDRGLETFLEVGEALLDIRDRRLYRAEFDTFEECCQANWSIKRAQAYRLIEAAKIVNDLSPMGDKSLSQTENKDSGTEGLGTNVPKPANERQVRALTKLKEPAKRRQAWTEAAKASGGKPTAKSVENAVGVIMATAQPALPAPPDAIDEEEEENEEPEVNPEIAEPEEDEEPEALPVPAKPALPIKESADERHCREDCESAVKLADGKEHSVIDIAKVIGRGERSVELFIARVRMLPWLTVEKTGLSKLLTARGKNAGVYRFTVDRELLAICDGRTPRPRVSGGIPPAKLKQIIDELHRRRKENNEKKNNRPINLANVLKVEMISTANWIEEALAELYKQYQV